MPRDCGNNWAGVCTLPPALTDQLDLVAISKAPISMYLVLLLRPIMGLALMSCCLINKVPSDWTGKNAKAEGPDDDCCEGVLCFNHDAVVLNRCHEIVAMLMGGLAPPCLLTDQPTKSSGSMR